MRWLMRLLRRISGHPETCRDYWQDEIERRQSAVAKAIKQFEYWRDRARRETTP